MSAYSDIRDYLEELEEQMPENDDELAAILFGAYERAYLGAMEKNKRRKALLFMEARVHAGEVRRRIAS